MAWQEHTTTESDVAVHAGAETGELAAVDALVLSLGLEGCDGGSEDVSLVGDLIFLSLDTVDFGGKAVFLSSESNLVISERVDGVEEESLLIRSGIEHAVKPEVLVHGGSRVVGKASWEDRGVEGVEVVDGDRTDVDITRSGLDGLQVGGGGLDIGGR
jgi:hypothetical protein